MARIKHVFSTDMVKHVWAQQNQDNGRNGSNTSFQGTTLYSYSTPIANFVTNKKNKRACLITTLRYSVTTSQSHMPHISDIPPGIPVFMVKHIGATGGRAPYPKTDNFHKENLADMAREYNEGLKVFARSKSYDPDSYILGNSHDIERAKDYCKFFGFRFTPAQFPPATRDLLDKLRAQSKKEAQEKARKTIAEKKKRAGECERKLNNHIELGADIDWEFKEYASPDQKQRLLEFDFKQAKENGWQFLPNGWEDIATEEEKHAVAEKELQDYFSFDIQKRTGLGWRWEQIASDEQKTRYEAERKEGAEKSISAFIAGKGELVPFYRKYASGEQVTAIAAIDLDNWRKGITSRPLHNYSETHLRVIGDQIETSRGAEFPVSHARRAWPVILNCKNGGHSWKKNGHTVHLGHFQLDRIEADGTVKAGCHIVRFAEVEFIAKQLNLA